MCPFAQRMTSYTVNLSMYLLSTVSIIIIEEIYLLTVCSCCAMDTAMPSCSYTREYGIAVGAMIMVAVLVAIVITVVVVQSCLWR